MDIKYYQIDEVAKLTGITKRTIRYYEDLELLKPARSDSSYRLYTKDDIDTISEVKNLRIKLGMNLSEIKRFMGLKKMINDILDGSEMDTSKINETKDRINELMEFIEDREEVLKKIKNNCCNYLDRLNKTVENVEAKENEKR
ncbi:MAG TPA: MerR family transcriptional regulator [Clostridiaceae bacterium]